MDHGSKPAVVVDRQMPARPARRREHGVGFVDGERHRLLDQDVEARRSTPDRDVRVRGRGCEHVHDVRLGCASQLLDVRVGGHCHRPVKACRASRFMSHAPASSTSGSWRR